MEKKNTSAAHDLSSLLVGPVKITPNTSEVTSLQFTFLYIKFPAHNKIFKLLRGPLSLYLVSL